jgi:hypothetical protein
MGGERFAVEDRRAGLKALSHDTNLFALLNHSVYTCHCLHDCFRYGVALLYDENTQCKWLFVNFAIMHTLQARQLHTSVRFSHSDLAVVIKARTTVVNFWSPKLQTMRTSIKGF